MKNLTIIKVGGSVITHKDSETPKAKLDVISRIAKEISEFYSSKPSPWC